MKNQDRALNWGLISTARINQALIPPLRQSQRNRLLAVASRDLGRAEVYAQTNGIPRAYGSYEDMLADPDVDAVYISLPNHLHTEWTVKACRAGKHVLCEKPLAISLEEVDLIQAEAKKAEVTVAEAFMYRHHPQTLKIQELVAAGAIGEVKFIRGSFSFMIQSPDIRLAPEWGGGSLWDVGCYPVSFAMMIVGEPPVEVAGWQDNGDTGVDMFFAGQMRFANGTLAQFDSGFNVPLYSVMEIRGTDGTIIVPTPFKPDPRQRVILQRENSQEHFAFPRYSPYLGELENFADAALDGDPQRVTLDQSRAHIATLLGLYQSARDNQPVRF